jgi:hypothetical protein
LSKEVIGNLLLLNVAKAIKALSGPQSNQHSMFKD